MRIFQAPTTMLSPVIRQFVKYGLVGVTNTLASLGVYALCVHFGLWYIAASALAFAVGAVNSYLLNRNWTFRARGRHTTLAARYAVVQVGGLLGILGVVFVMVDELGTDKVIGQAIAQVIVVLAMFVANRYWTFADALALPVRVGPSAPDPRVETPAAPGAVWTPAPPPVTNGTSENGRDEDRARGIAATSRPRS